MLNENVEMSRLPLHDGSDSLFQACPVLAHASMLTRIAVY